MAKPLETHGAEKTPMDLYYVETWRAGAADSVPTKLSAAAGKRGVDELLRELQLDLVEKG